MQEAVRLWVAHTHTHTHTHAAGSEGWMEGVERQEGICLSAFSSSPRPPACVAVDSPLVPMVSQIGWLFLIVVWKCVCNAHCCKGSDQRAASTELWLLLLEDGFVNQIRHKASKCILFFFVDRISHVAQSRWHYFEMNKWTQATNPIRGAIIFQTEYKSVTNWLITRMIKQL